ncbi:hypothetical protein [Streptococcus suis]
MPISEGKKKMENSLAVLTGFGVETGMITLESQERAGGVWEDNSMQEYEQSGITRALTC